MSVLDEYAQDFAVLNDRERFVYLIELGEELQTYPQEYKTKEYEVSGCQSRVYIALIQENDSYNLYGYADAKVIRGYLKILIDALTHKTLAEIQNDTSVEEFIKQTPLHVGMQAGRTNAFASMYKFIKEQAKQFKGK